jgi:NADPH:quinone reductase
MRAVTINQDGDAPTLHNDVPEPAPAAGEVLVRVRASSVNPIDVATAAGMLKQYAEHVYPITLGRDFAGTVEAVGQGVITVAAGDEVFGMVPSMRPDIHAGAWSELISVSEATLTVRPQAVSVKLAGAVGMAAATAVPTVEAIGPHEGDVVLVVGATGGVGTIIVQLLDAAGVTVVAPAHPEHEAYLREFGVTAFVPRDGDVAAAVLDSHPAGVDAIVDLVSYAPGAHDAALKDGGRVASPLNAAGDGPGRTNIHNAASGELYKRIGAMLADGSLKLPIAATYDLGDAPVALNDLGAKHTQGKLAIQIS